jgi:predicted metalloprotease with PDZ domain
LQNARRRERLARGARWRWIALPCALLVLVLASVGGPARKLIGNGAYVAAYDVVVSDPARGVLEITLRIRDFDGPQLLLGRATGASDAGTAPTASFRLRDACDARGRMLPVADEGRTWRIAPERGPLTVHYQVALQARRPTGDFDDELFSRCDEQGARLLGADVFLFPMVGEPGALQVRYQLPPTWRLVHPFQTGELTASYPNLRALYHSVVAAGPYRVLTRDVGGCALVLAVLGEFRFSDDVLLDVLSRLARYELSFLGPAPRPRYVFVVNPHPKTGDPQRLHYFGLNFDGSMLLLIDGDTDRERLNAEPASLCAHEFFHNWLGETVRQSDYAMNWFIEGVTTFYAYQVRMDAQMLPFDDYTRDLAGRYREEYISSSLRDRESVAMAGQTVLEDEAHTRYLYAGGLLLAVALDQEIDQATGQRASLDDLVRGLVKRARHDDGFLLTRDTLESQLRELTGREFGPWLARYVYGTQVPQLPAYVTTAPRS